MLDERSARRGPLAELGARLGERLAARAGVDLEAVGAPLRALGPLAQLRDLVRFLPGRDARGWPIASMTPPKRPPRPPSASPRVQAALPPSFRTFIVLTLTTRLLLSRPHEDALALEAADFPALAIEGRVAAQAAELDPHRFASRRYDLLLVRVKFQICSPFTPASPPSQPALCGHCQGRDV